MFRENRVGFTVQMDKLLIANVYSSCDGTWRGSRATLWRWRAETDSTWTMSLVSNVCNVFAIACLGICWRRSDEGPDSGGNIGLCGGDQ